MQNLSIDSAFDVVSTGAASGTTAVTSTPINLADYDGVLFIVDLGTVTAGAQPSAQLQDCATSNGTFANVGSPASYTDAGGASSNGIMLVDCLNIQQPWVQLVLSRNTQAVAVNSITAIRYRSKKRPVVQGTTVVAQALANAQN